MMRITGRIHISEVVLLPRSKLSMPLPLLSGFRDQMELLPYGITVNCVAPGIMYSDLTRSIIKAGKRSAGDSEYDNAINLQLHNTHNEEIAAELVYFLTSMDCNTITGKLISAVWDPWKDLPKYSDILSQTDIYTLRRIIPADRNLTIE